MNRSITIVFYLYLYLFSYQNVHSQVQVSDSVKYNYTYFNQSLNKTDSIISLPHKFLVRNSIVLYIDSSFIQPSDYKVNQRYGIITLDRDLVISFNRSQKNYIRTEVFYKYYPYNLPDLFSKFEILQQIDTVNRDTLNIGTVRSDIFEDIFAGSELQRSGNIFRGFTVGNNRDLTLNSGFRLQLNGKLSKDIDVIAALTDENTPIQPEGNTQKLQELDKVFIELRSRDMVATLGDIEVNYSGLNFFNFNRKVQGAKGFGSFGFADILLNASVSRGKFSTNNFNGIDGIQGPYRLTGANNEVNIIVIAGSEKVYLDGQLMVRGENNDYIIDYPIGQLTFSTKRLITGVSRIVVDFEYSDKKYSRTLLSGQAKLPVIKNKMNVSVSYMRESDDSDKPIDFLLSDEDRQRMMNAGDDIFRASKSGVTFVGTDSVTGIPLGMYMKADTVIGANVYEFWRYKPGDDSALYQVNFSFVGSGKGDYTSLSTTAYSYSGPGKGNYLPVVLLPLPAAYQSADVQINYTAGKNFVFNVETAVSDLDKNLFSEIDDTENKGLALISSVTYNNNNLRFGRRPGYMSATLRQKYINKLYNNVDRLNQIEYDRIWDIRDTEDLTEVVTEGELLFSPVSFAVLRGIGGIIKRGSDFNSQRGSVQLNFLGDSLGLPFVYYDADFITSQDNVTDYNGFWFRNSGLIEYNLFKNIFQNGYAKLFLNFNGEDKKQRTFSTNSLSSGSFRYYEFIPGVTFNNLFGFDFTYKMYYRLDDVFNSGYITRQSNAFTHTLNLNLSRFRNITGGVNLTVYNKYFTNDFRNSGFTDAKTVLLDSRVNMNMLDNAVNTSLFYKISNERAAKSEVIFVKVQMGQGNYTYIGDLNGNNIQDENEFKLVNFDGEYIKIISPTEQTFPTTNVQTSLNFAVKPGQLLNVKNNGLIFDLLNNISMESYLSVDEKSKDPVQSNIYFLKLDRFQNEQNTINGIINIRQDINFFKDNEYFGLRLRFNQKRAFNQYFSGNERQLYIERSARLKLAFTPDLSFTNEFRNENDGNVAPENSLRNRSIVINSLNSELVYSPYENVQVGFDLILSRAADNYLSNPTKVDMNSQIFKFSYSLGELGRIRANVERNEAIFNTEPFYIPYELTKGKPAGKSFFWTLSMDYKLTDFIQATINYLGRAENDSRIIHTGTAEFKAFF